jgi:hypothetical protein
MTRERMRMKDEDDEGEGWWGVDAGGGWDRLIVFHL